MGASGCRGDPEPADGEAVAGRRRRNDSNNRNRATWLYAAIDVETKLLLDIWIFPRRGTDPAAEFLGRLAEKHDLSGATLSAEWVI